MSRRPLKPLLRRPSIALFLATSLAASAVRADSIFVGTLERKNAVVTELRGDKLEYQFNGRDGEVPISKVSRIIVDAEPALTRAEEAYSLSKWDDAVDGYQKVIRTAGKSWAKDFAALRLVDAAAKSGRFDAAASAYVQLLLKDPASAAAMKPALPGTGSTYLDTAAEDVKRTLTDMKLTTDQRRALLGFLLEIHEARHDATAQDAIYEQIAKLPGADPNDAAAQRMVARRRLLSAARAFDARNFKQAADEVEANRAVFIDPAQQADALMLLAESRANLAGADATADADALKDSAIAYMRVVALAKNLPNRPHVATALFKTAVILEKVSDPQSALRLYRQIKADFPDDPAAQSASQALARLDVSSAKP